MNGLGWLSLAAVGGGATLVVLGVRRDISSNALGDKLPCLSDVPAQTPDAHGAQPDGKGGTCVNAAYATTTTAMKWGGGLLIVGGGLFFFMAKGKRR
jgi:hypothetical protein